MIVHTLRCLHNCINHVGANLRKHRAHLNLIHVTINKIWSETCLVCADQLESSFYPHIPSMNFHHL